jgi:hypothetical protein
MMMFLDSERVQNVDMDERQLTIPDVVQQSEQFVCGKQDLSTTIERCKTQCKDCKHRGFQ